MRKRPSGATLRRWNSIAAIVNAPPLDVANAVRPLAILSEEAGDTEAARRLWEEARDLYEACGVQAGVDECSERLARLNCARA